MPTQQEWRAELEKRRASVWSILQKNECDLGLVFGSEGHAEPFRYLTNFSPVIGDMWAIISGPAAISCVLNFDWQLIEARQLSGIDDWRGIFDAVPTVVETLAARSPRKIGVINLNRLPVTAFDAIKAKLPNTAFSDLSAEVALLRRQKSPLEVELLREAGRITDSAFDAVRGELKPGLTEFEVVAMLGYAAQKLGAEWAFFPTVIGGTDNPIMIRQPTSRRLQVGDSVMIDIGAMYQGYQADAARTFVLGQPNADQRKVWDTILRAYDAVLKIARPGTACIDLHRTYSRVLEEAGYKAVHRVGHGIGLATSFEWPNLAGETGPLLPGVTICLEPGVYVPGAGNMKLEDDIVITDMGYDLLTTSSRELVVPL